MSKAPAKIEERLEFMVNVLGQGRAAVQEYQDRFGLNYNQYYEDRKQALEMLRDRLEDKAELWARDLVERYEELYKRSLQRNDLKNAEKALAGLMKLKGLDTQRLEVKTDQDIDINWGLGDELQEG